MTTTPPTPPPLADAIAALESDFAFLDDWEARFAHLLDLGRAAPSLAPQERVEANRVRGCASQVWLVTEPAAHGALRFRGESDAHLVRGLVALMTGLFSGRAPQDILDTDFPALVRRLGLGEALSPQRSNGLAALWARMRADAERAAAQTRP